MDEWQRQIYKRLSDFVSSIEDNSLTITPELKIPINHKEAYVIVKALEDQQRYLNPLIKFKLPKPQENRK